MFVPTYLVYLLNTVALTAALPGKHSYGSPFTITESPATSTPCPSPGSTSRSIILLTPIFPGGPGPVLDSQITTLPTTSSFTFSCDMAWCEDGTSYCAYWAGSTSYDVILGKPVPGELRTSLGTCTVGSVKTTAIPSHTSAIDPSTITRA